MRFGFSNGFGFGTKALGDGASPAVLLQATSRSVSMGFTRQLFTQSANDFTQGDFRYTDSTARYPINGCRLIYANYGLSSGEQPGSADLTIYSGIEDLDAGVTTPVLFGGSTTVVIPPGDIAVSDLVSVSFPAITEFAERSTARVPTVDDWFWDGSGATAEFTANGLMQAHNTGPLADTGSSLLFYGYSPIGCVAELPAGAMSILGLGDSIMMGAFSNIGSVTRVGVNNVNGGGVPFANFGRTFEYLQALADDRGIRRIAHAQYCTHVFIQIGTNDLSAINLATMQARYTIVANALRAMGKKVVMLSLPPRDASVGVYYNSLFEPGGVKDQINAWFAASVPSLFDGYIDWAQFVSDEDGHWLPDISDLTHPDPAGVALASPAVTAYIEAELKAIEEQYRPVVLASGVLSGTPATGETVTYTLPIARGFPEAAISFLKNGVLQDSVASGYPDRSVDYYIDPADWADDDVLSVSTVLSNPAGEALSGPDVSNSFVVEGFNPAQLSGLIAFINTFNETTITVSTGAIDRIDDLTTSNYDLTASTTIRPTVATDAFGAGKDGARLDGVDDRFDFGLPRSATAANSFTMFVGYKSNNPTKAGRIYALSNGASPTGALTHSSASVQAQFGTTGTLSVSRTADSNPHVVGMYRDKPSGACGVFYDGTRTTGTGSTDITTTHGPFIGRELNNLNQLQGDIAIVLVYNRDLTLAEKNQVGAWVANQIGSSWSTMV